MFCLFFMGLIFYIIFGYAIFLFLVMQYFYERKIHTEKLKNARIFLKNQIKRRCI